MLELDMFLSAMPTRKIGISFKAKNDPLCRDRKVNVVDLDQYTRTLSIHSQPIAPTTHATHNQQLADVHARPSLLQWQLLTMQAAHVAR